MAALYQHHGAGVSNILIDSDNGNVGKDDIFITVDSTLGAVTLVLPAISTLGNATCVRLSILDQAGTSRTHAISLMASGTDIISGSTVIDVNGSQLQLSISDPTPTTGKWASISVGALSGSPFPLGDAGSYVVLTAGALTIGTAGQPFSGNVGHSGVETGTDTFIYGADYTAPVVNGAIGAAETLYTQLTTLTPTYNFLPGAVVLSTVDTGHGAGIFKPGIYSGTGAASTPASGIVTLDGAGIYVFLFDGAITTGAGTTIVLKNGAAASQVFWAASAALTTGDGTIWKGTFVSPAGASPGVNQNFEGRLLSTGAAISLGAGVNAYYLPTLG